MKLCDMFKTIWENVVGEKTFFIKVIAINTLICLMYLIIPASLKTFLGVVFASIGESSIGVYEFLEENLVSIENVISALIAFILVIACLITLISIFSTLEKDNKIYRLQKSFGMSPMALVGQSLIQNLLVCLTWNVLSIIIAEFFVFVASAVLAIEISITIMYFIILLTAELLITVIASLLNYLVILDNTKSESIQGE